MMATQDAMAPGPAPAPRRLTVTLDPEFPVERCILSRLQRLRRGRGQEWLRGLLVAGYQHEAGAVVEDVARRAAPAHAPVAEPLAMPTRPAPPPARTSAPAPVPSVSDSTAGPPPAKPFARLQRVVG